MNRQKHIYICGSGGTAREAFGILKSQGLSKYVKGLVVGNEYSFEESTIYSVPVVSENESSIYDSDSVCVMAVGSPEKKQWIRTMQGKGAHFMSVIHRSCIMLEGTRVGEGVIIFPGVIMTANISVGDFTIINSGATVGHDTKIGSFCHIAPGVHIAGNVTIGNDTWVGIGSSTTMNIKIGSHVMIGAGAAVISDIPDNTLAYGVPAKDVRSISGADWKDLLR